MKVSEIRCVDSVVNEMAFTVNIVYVRDRIRVGGLRGSKGERGSARQALLGGLVIILLAYGKVHPWLQSDLDRCMHTVETGILGCGQIWNAVRAEVISLGTWP